MNNEKKSPISYFKTYLGHVWYDFKTSFKYNNMKIVSWLLAIPGIFLGFFLGFHADIVGDMKFVKAVGDEEIQLLKPFDFSGVVLFLMILASILNIFTAATVSSKKNLSSVVMATITTSFIVIFGGLYLFAVFYYMSLYSSGEVKSATGFFDLNLVVSIASVAISMISSIVGVVIGYIRYDRTYEKVDR